jgi:hypothetical protein
MIRSGENNDYNRDNRGGQSKKLKIISRPEKLGSLSLQKRNNRLLTPRGCCLNSLPKMRIVTARAYDFAHLLLSSSSSSMMSQCSFDRAVFLEPIAVLAILGFVSNKPSS